MLSGVVDLRLKPSLTIITITYNDAEGLGRTLASLASLDKSLSSENIIVDSSPEINASIIKHYKNESLIHLKTLPNGIYAAFNLGLEHAQGDLVWFLNGGDRLKSSRTLMDAIAVISANPDLELLCAGVDFYRDGRFIYSATPKASLIKNLMGQNSLCHQGVIYRRSVFNRIGNFSLKYQLASDYDHHFRCFFAKAKTLSLPLIIAEYDRGGRSDSFKPVVREFRTIWRVNRKQLGVQLAIVNEFLGFFNYLKLQIMKSALHKPFSMPLKRIWYKCHRH